MDPRGLGDWLAPSRIALDARASSKGQALAITARLLAGGSEGEAASIEQALNAREADGTTGYGRGCAVPHGRCPGPARAAFVRFAAPVDWEALDGQPVRLVLALVSSPDDGAVHLRMLARASRALADDRLRERLAGARDAAAAWALLCRQDKAGASHAA